MIVATVLFLIEACALTWLIVPVAPICWEFKAYRYAAVVHALACVLFLGNLIYSDEVSGFVDRLAGQTSAVGDVQAAEQTPSKGTAVDGSSNESQAAEAHAAVGEQHADDSRIESQTQDRLIPFVLGVMAFLSAVLVFVCLHLSRVFGIDFIGFAVGCVVMLILLLTQLFGNAVWAAQLPNNLRNEASQLADEMPASGRSASDAAGRTLVEQALRAVESSAARVQESPNAMQPQGATDRESDHVRLIAAVSFSLSEGYREELKRDADKIGMRFVLRGLPVPEGMEKRPYFTGNEAEKARQRSAIRQGVEKVAQAFGGASIDPAFFQANDITSVPVFVLEDDTGTLLKVRGAVTVGYALERFYTTLSTIKERSLPHRLIADERRRAALEAVVRMGCDLKRGSLNDEHFMGEACEVR